MPELPEVERARKLIQDTCAGFRIKSVVSTEDKIVYTGGTNHEEFAREIEGRTIQRCERKGKTFWLVLDGEGRQPVMHFGMTGMIQLKGQDPTWYRRRPRERSKEWPPRLGLIQLCIDLTTSVLELESQSGAVGQEPIELAFLDARRLGRLRLLPHPVQDHPPVSKLGFDPVLNHPTLEEFQDLINKKKGTTKGMIMDQAFSAGVGNWVADEVLYQARIHPACPVPSLSADDIQNLHHQLRNVCQTAVGVNADHRQFPEDWLFRWRWSKGKKQEKGSAKQKLKESSDEDGDEDVKPKNKDFLALPNGRPATIEFIEVGGRTTAVVMELQKMPDGVDIKPKISKGGKGSRSKKGRDSESEAGSSGLSDESEVERPAKVVRSRSGRVSIPRVKLEASPVEQQLESPAKTKRKRASKAKDEDDVKTEPASTPAKVRLSLWPYDKADSQAARPANNSSSAKRSSRTVKAEPESSDLSDAA